MEQQKGKRWKNPRSRILISDMVLANGEELRKMGIQSLTEVKFENSISRMTAIANPRQIERVIRGSIFEAEFIYEMENEAEFLEDMETLGEGLKLLQYDYLGGHGSRGYGKVVFRNFEAEPVVGTIDETLIEQCNEILKKAIEI